MVRATLQATLALALLLPCTVGRGEDAEADRAIARAMGQSRLPWYDKAADAARPIHLREPWSWSSSDSSSSGRSWWPSWPDLPTSGGRPRAFGNLVGLAWFGVGMVALIGLLLWLFKIFEPSFAEEPAAKRLPASPSLIEHLPDGFPVGFDSADPWAEAVRRRSQGDLNGAIICLFAHQMLTLERLGLVQLAPGRTGRQLVSAVTDAEVRGLVRPTLALFESACYGHRDPTADDFAAAWSRAEAFEKRVAAGASR